MQALAFCSTALIQLANTGCYTAWGVGVGGGSGAPLTWISEQPHLNTGLSSQPFIYFSHSPILGQGWQHGRWTPVFELNTCFKIILMVHRLQVTHSLSTCSVHKLHTHTHKHTHAFSFCGFAKWFFIDSIDWAFPPHLSSSGISCAVKQYGSLPPDRKSLGVPIDLNQPSPAHQLSIYIELTVLRYRAMNQSPRTIWLMCACGRMCK